jgi:hypothetical protein
MWDPEGGQVMTMWTRGHRYATGAGEVRGGRREVQVDVFRQGIPRGGEGRLRFRCFARRSLILPTDFTPQSTINSLQNKR